jgi:hypothetical protein
MSVSGEADTPFDALAAALFFAATRNDALQRAPYRLPCPFSIMSRTRKSTPRCHDWSVLPRMSTDFFSTD